jgi:predicted regulator of Ras-like GTPase activity (Roadblock/LC7/MglB family)
VDAAQALADLTEISSQIEGAVLFSEDGSVLGSTLDDDQASRALVRGALELLDGAAAFRGEDSRVVQIEASTPEGSVFVVRDGDRGIVAATAPQPTVGLVFYDLKSCLRASGTEPEQRPRRRAAPAQEPPAEPVEEGGSAEA